MLVINYDRQHSIFNYELNMVKKRDSGASVTGKQDILYYNL